PPLPPLFPYTTLFRSPARSRPAATYPTSTTAASPQAQALGCSCSWSSGVRASCCSVSSLARGMRLVRRLSGADDRGVHPVRGVVRELHARTREPRLGEAVEVLGVRRGSGAAPSVGTAASTVLGG